MQWDYFNDKVREEIVSVIDQSSVLNLYFIQVLFGLQFFEYAHGPSVPHVHPIIQLMTAEWKDVFINCQKPHWNLFTDAFIAASCNEASMANPDWNDLYATDLNVHLIGTSSASMWWILPSQHLLHLLPLPPTLHLPLLVLDLSHVP